AQRAGESAMAALQVAEVRLGGQVFEGREHLAVGPGIVGEQLPHFGHGHGPSPSPFVYCAGATSPASITLCCTVLPSIFWSSPTSESFTVPRTTRTFRPRMLFAIVLSATKLPASIDTLGPTVESWIVTPSSM